MSINSGDRPWGQALNHEDLDWPAEDQRILVPFCEAANRTEASLLGASITFGSDGELYILHATDPDEGRGTDTSRNEAEPKMEVRDQFPIPVFHDDVPHSPGVLDSFVESHSITATVVDREESGFFSRGRDTKAVAKGCHSIVATRMDMFESPTSILVPVAKGPHSGLATRVAESITRAYEGWMELFHVIPQDATERQEDDAHKLLDAYESRLDDNVEVDHHVTRAPDPADAIIEHSNYHDMTILGAPEKGKLRRFFFGSTTDDVKQDVGSGPVLTTHRHMNESMLSHWF